MQTVDHPPDKLDVIFIDLVARGVSRWIERLGDDLSPLNDDLSNHHVLAVDVERDGVSRFDVCAQADDNQIPWSENGRHRVVWDAVAKNWPPLT